MKTIDVLMAKLGNTVKVRNGHNGGRQIDRITKFLVWISTSGTPYVCSVPETDIGFCLNPVEVINDELVLSPASCGPFMMVRGFVSLMDAVLDFNAECATNRFGSGQVVGLIDFSEGKFKYNTIS